MEDSVITHQTHEFQYTDTALPLLSYNPSDKIYELSPTALSMLRSITGRVSVVTVAGLYRTGKSYLLNQVLLGRKSGFGVGPSINPCTKGMWIWGRPLLSKTCKGDPCSLLLIDTEGIGALDEDSTHDSRIFSLAVLFASCFVYNSVGSIDESALSSMSLVLNLAKNITVKSDKPSSENLSQYFPSFLWVVRDFALQLVDETGRVLSSKEYLEKALMPQKGFSEMSEEKNRIRTLIKSYFKERECFTLVRPTTNEAELQKLDEKDLDTLRPEFISQARELKTLIFSKMRPKEINGRELTGEMFADLIESYVGAINTGAAPCIESTWSYLCKNQMVKVLSECEEEYEKLISELLEDQFPVSEEELKRVHKECKLKALQHFRKVAVGDEVEETLEKLKERIREKFESIYLSNKDGCKIISSRFLQENYSVISQKLKKGQFKAFQDFEKELKILKEYAKGHCPIMDSEYLGEFLAECTSAAGDHFIRSLANEVSLQKEVLKDTVSRLESEFKETREGLQKERELLRGRVSSLENEKAELALRDKSSQEKIEELKQDKESYEKEFRSTVRSLKTEFNEKIEETTKKCWEYEEKIKELERKIFQSQSDSSQELALLQQKTVYLEKSLAEAENRELRSVNELKAYKQNHNSLIKEFCSKQEDQLSVYQTRLLQEAEKSNELEKMVCEKEVEIEQLKVQLEESEAKLGVLFAESKETEEFGKARLDQREQFYKQELERSIEKYEKDLHHLKESLQSAEDKLREFESAKVLKFASSNKETAILEQKVEFLEQELRDTRRSLEEEKKHQKHLLASMGSLTAESHKDEFLQEIKKMQDTHEKELRAKEDTWNIQRVELTQEITFLKESLEELEIQLKVSQTHRTEKERETVEELESLKSEKTRLLEKIKSLNSEYSAFVEETEVKAKVKSRELEERSEQLVSYYSRENSEIKVKHEEIIVQLKKYCEDDKSRMEARIKEERDRSEKKFSLACEEYERRIQEEQDHFDSEVTSLQQELRDLHERSTHELQALRHKSDFDSQKIETLEKYLSSTKDQINSIQNSNAQALEAHLQAFNSERATLLDKIEKLASDIASRERENANFTFRIDQAQTRAALKEKELEETKEQYNRERGLFIERLETAKQANHKLADEISQKMSDYKREIALANQHIEFQCKKIADLEKTIQENTHKYSDSFKMWRNESGVEFTETIEKLNVDKEAAEKKLEEYKRKSKENELRLNKQITCLEKEKVLLAEKVSFLENKKSETEKRLQEELKDLNSQILCSKEFDSLGRSIYLVENEKLKSKNNEFEKTIAELAAGIERDKVLWENKFNFLVQQRDQARNDLVESQQKFDTALERLQKRGNLDRDKAGTATASLISSVEARYSSQIKEIHEKYTNTITELTQKNKALEREMRNLKEEYEIDKRTRNSDTGFQGRKIQDLVNSEKRLISELEELKASKESKTKELMEVFRSEKENFKGKLQESEQRIKELEYNKSQLFLEHEKERAKWALERDHLISQKNEAQDIVESLEKRKDTLMKENEKLKATRGRVSSSKMDSLATVNKSYMPNLYSTNISFDEVSKEVKPISPANNVNDFSPLPLRLKNYGGMIKKRVDDKGLEGLYQGLGEIVRKPKRNLNENIKG